MFFPEKGCSTDKARAICLGCEAINACLIKSFEMGERYGVWGGIAERRRREIVARLRDGTSDVIINELIMVGRKHKMTASKTEDVEYLATAEIARLRDYALKTPAKEDIDDEIETDRLDSL